MSDDASRVSKPFDGRVVLADYDPGWPELYEREAARIRSLLDTRALRIEHTGSTSVPALPAKPIVDMLLVVEDTTDEGAYVPALEGGGYVLRIREPEWHEHRMFKGPLADVNLHVFSSGCPKSIACCCFETGCVRTVPIANCTHAPNESFHSGSGGRWTITRWRRPLSSSRS